MELSQYAYGRTLDTILRLTDSQNHRLSRWLGKALKGHNADKAPEGAPKGLPTAFLFPATLKGASFMPSCSRYP